MWIIPNTLKKDLEQSHFAPDMVDLNEDWKAQGLESSPSLLVKSKPIQLQTYWRKWKKVPYLARLFGRTLKPSQWQSFTEKWTSLLEGSPVSLSVPQGQEKEMKTPDIYSPILNDSLKLLNPDICSWKTSTEFLPRNLKETTGPTPKERPFCSMYVESWKGWATAWRRGALMRKKWGHHINETVGLSTGNWGTVRTSSANGASQNEILKGDPKKRLECQVNLPKNWPTPTVVEAGKISNKPNYGQLGLSNHPQVHGYERGRPKKTKSRKGEKMGWDTGQQDPDHISTATKNPEQLTDWQKRIALKEWTTPTSSMTARSEKFIAGSVRKIAPQEWAAHVKQQLNPNWVEQLMGLPVGWTQLPTEWNEYECVEMELYHKQPGELGQSYSGKLETEKKGKHQFTKSQQKDLQIKLENTIFKYED